MIQILHYQSKQQFKEENKQYEKFLSSDIVSYTTKKGNIKVVKNRYGSLGKFTKAQYIELLEEYVLIHKEAPSLLAGTL